MHMEPPASLTTDREGGFISALREIWPNVPHLLYIWHINNDIKAHYKLLWRRNIDNSAQEGGRLLSLERKSYINGTWKSLLND